MTHIFANDLPYIAGGTDPFEALHSALAFSSRDWGAERDLAWIYGIVAGWDCDEDHEHDWLCSGDAMAELAERFGWSEEQVERLRALHKRFMDGAS